MKKITSIALAVMLIFALAVTAMAAEIAGCTVSADSVWAAAGQTVTVPVRVLGNPGFTNFGIALDYDREQLELVSIQTAHGETPYLCGATASVNTQWKDADEKTYGYVAAASAQAVSGDGILFTATFRVSEAFSGAASVRPVVQYFRNNQRLFPAFETIGAKAEAGTVSAELIGDYNRDGEVTVTDVMRLFNAIGSGETFTEDDLARLDINRDGEITVSDVMGIYAIVMGGR